MVDVSKCKNVKIADKVLLIGKSGKNIISICQHAMHCGTISYEILTRLGLRIKRQYKE